MRTVTATVLLLLFASLPASAFSLTSPSVSTQVQGEAPFLEIQSSFSQAMAVAPIPQGKRVIAPQGPQAQAFLKSPADIVIFGGVAGCEKTYSILLDPLRHVHDPAFEAVIFRRTTTEILKSGALWDTSYELYRLCGAEPNRTRLEWRFPSGAKITFAHMEHEDDRFAWAGSQVAVIAFDQVETFTERQFWFMLSRNRSAAKVRPYMRATCNPVTDNDAIGGWLHRLIRWWLDDNGQFADWDKSGVIRWFVRSEIDNSIEWGDSREELTDKHGEDCQPMSFTFIPGRLEENKAMLDRDPGYRARLRNLLPIEQQKLLHGDWSAREAAGDFFQREWFEIVEANRPLVQSIRYWDRAGTANNPGGSWTAGCLMGKDDRGMFYIVDMSRFQATPADVQTKIKNVASQDGKDYRVGIEQDPGQAGLAEAQTYVREMAGFQVVLNVVREAKGVRAKPLATQVFAGNVKLVRGDWNEAFLREAEHFDGTPKCASDQVDAASGAFHMLTTNQTSTAIFGSGRGVRVG